MGLYDLVRDAPIISSHGHVGPALSTNQIITSQTPPPFCFNLMITTDVVIPIDGGFSAYSGV